MKYITLYMRKTDPRPIIHLENFFGIDALLDTGSVLPIWTHSESYLQKIGGVKVRENIPFVGFGGVTKGTLYRIPTFTLGELTFPHLPIIAAKMNEPFYMLLSAPMFSQLIYEIDNVHHKLNITIPDAESTIRNITFRDADGRLKIVLANEISTCL